MQVIKDMALRMLNVYVSPYVDNLNPDDLQLSILAGKAEFHGLRLKKSVLERFGLPVEIVAGDIGSLSLTIPWQAMKSQPAQIVIDDIFVLARARPQGKVDPEEDERIDQATKQEKLRSAEAVDSAANQVEQAGGAENKETYFGAIATRIINNVQIHIKNIHLRYEDGTSTPDHPFAAGLTISEFKMVSTDENWVEAFLENDVKDVHKLSKLSALSVYFDTDATSIAKPDNRDGTIDALKAMLVGNPAHQHILKPVTGEARLVIHRTMTNTTPQYDVQALFDEIGVVLDRAQYRDALSMIDVFHFYRRTHQYYKYRPPEEEFKENPAKARWKYALNAISAEVHDRNRKWSWDYLKERRDQRIKYVDLYVQKLSLPEDTPLPPDEQEELDQLERELSFEDIRFFRSVARVQARRDAATRKKLEAEQAKTQPQTWGQWLWGSRVEDSQDPNQITEDEQKEIDDLIDYDAWSAAETSVGTARDLIKMRISTSLNKGSFSLRASPREGAQDVIALVFDSFSADVDQLVDSMKLKMALGGFRVYDGTTPKSLYPQIVRVKDIDGAKGESRSGGRQQSLPVGGASEALAELSTKYGITPKAPATAPAADPFFSLEYEHNPLDGRADNAVTVKMRHLEIIYHRNYVEEVVAFFKPPASQLESINALLDAAGETLDGIRKETRAGLEYALEQHKTLDLHVDMNAPIIIIPMDVTVATSQLVVIDAGHIAVDSKLADKEKLKDVQAKRGRQYSDDDYKQLEDLMYDRMLLSLDSTQLLMGDDFDACMEALNSHGHGANELHIVERINMSFRIQNAIVNAPNLTKFKIQGELPELQVNFSDRKYQTLMKFIDECIPRFGDNEPEEVAEHPANIPVLHNTPFVRPAKLEEYTLDDHHETRSVSSHKDAESDKGHDQFFEAKDDQTENQRRELQQVNFDFSFTVGKLQASLFRSTSPTTEKALANASLDGFGLTFVQRKYEMSVDLFLHNITLAMVEQGKAQRPLLSSAEVDNTSDQKLIKVKYHRVQKESPDFMTVHEGVDQSIDTELSTFNITLAAEPILSLYDFIMTTFVPKAPEEGATIEELDSEGAKVPAATQPVAESQDKLRIRVKLTSAQVSLENNDVRFALLSLPSADVALLLRAGTMRVSARLGNISLEDTSSDQVASPEFKKMLTIEGEELADFSYETFNPDDPTFPGYNSSILLRAGSLKFTFMEQGLHNLYTFALKFARMKAVYDAAQQAAVQRASEVTRMRYDIAVKTPIIILPRDGLTSPDVLVMKLGEIVARNQYLSDPNDTSTIDASLSGINVSSELYVDDKKANLQLIDDVTITAAIKQYGNPEHRTDPHKADSEITTEMSDVKLSLTQNQYVLVMGLLESLPRALSNLNDDDEEEDSSDSTPPTPSVAPTPSAPPTETDGASTVAPSIATPSEAGGDTALAPELIIANNDNVWTSLDFVFNVKSIGMEVYGPGVHTEEDLKNHSIARFGLTGSHLAFKTLSNSAMELEFSLKTLAFWSTHNSESVFRDIVPASTNDGNQIMVQYTKTADQQAMAIVSIDSPRFILAVEPLAALAEFAVAPFKSRAEAQPPVGEDELEAEAPAPSDALSFRIDIVNSTVIVLADDSDSRSQAIHLSIKEILVSQNNVLALRVDDLGMSFGRMDDPNDRVSFLDDVGITLSLDRRQKGAHIMTVFDIDVPSAIIFRASVSDILLILDIVNKATTAASNVFATEAAQQAAVKPAVPPKPIAATTIDETVGTVANLRPPQSQRRRSSLTRPRTASSAKTRILVSHEQLSLRVNGFQFVLVSDVQEMPVVHLSTTDFICTVSDWSSDLKAATSVTTAIRYYNLNNSYFEPLMDPWKFDLQVARTSGSGVGNPLSVRLTADQRVELSITSAFIELGITTMTILDKASSQAIKDKGPAAPFRMRNRTGLPITIWPETDDLATIPWHKRKVLEDGADVPWYFEDRQTLRDNVSAFRHNAFGLELPDSTVKWEPVRGISVDRAGEHVLNLRPKIDKVTHQLMCEIKLENNIKIITIRSTLNVENQTSLPVEMIVVDAHGKASGNVMRIDPGEPMPVPFEAVFDKRFRLRPLRGFGFDYGWSTPLHWRQLINRPIRPISCKHMTPKEPAFYFQAQANFNTKEPSARVYPRMTLTLRAPVELENLLPYDLKFRIHDKATSLSSSNFLVKGGTSPIHTVELSHLLLLSVAPEDTIFKQSDYAIINTDDPELPMENGFNLSDPKGNKLLLKLHYHTYPNSGGAFKVQVYSPFIILNKTGLPFDVMVKSTLGGAKPVAGRDLFATDFQREAPTPFMLSFPSDDRRNRLLLRVADSKLSQPLSFEPVAADMQIVLPSDRGDKEYYVGLSYHEGLGKYKLSKVITIAPRFLVKNMSAYPIQVRQSSDPHPLAIISPDQRKPIRSLSHREALQLRLAFDGPNSTWSAPFNIADIGTIHVTMERQTSRGPRTYLMRVETHLDGSSVFIFISRETEPWPIKLRNETNIPFKFKQMQSPEDGGDSQTYVLRDLKPDSEVDYTWDWPVSRNKRLQLYRGQTLIPRPIDVMAIGVQTPLKIPPQQAGERPVTISIDIRADGNSQLIVISNYSAERSIFKPTRRSGTPNPLGRSESSESLSTTGFETEATLDKATMSITVELEGVGISLVTKRPDELLYFTARGLKVVYNDFPTYHDVLLDCKWIQIDNQLFGGLFPIVFYPTVVPKDGKELDSHPTVQLAVALLKDQSHGVIFVKYASVLLQAMTVELDEDFIMALIDFLKFKEATWREDIKDVLIEQPKGIPGPDIVRNKQDNFFFESLQLQPVSLELSFMRTDRVNVDDKVSTRNPLYYLLNALTMTLGNVNAAPINFRALFLENVRLSSHDLQERIVLHYQEQAVQQIYRVLGSADFLGNPVGLFNNISSGFSDFFYEPWQGFVMHGNRDIGLGIARGATSFAKKTVFGLSDSVTKVSSSIGKGLSAATLDQDYQNKRRMNQKRNKPKHALYGVAAGATAFADSVTSAFEGVASMPMEGAEQGGAAGFAKGVGKGFVGLFTKPAVGLFDFIAASTEGIRNTTTVFDQNEIERVRLPRFIAADGVLRPFSGREALGQSWLKDLDAGQYFGESYVAHLDLPSDDAVALLSSSRLLYVQQRKMRTIWQVPFDELQSLSLESSGIALTLRGGTPGPFLPIADQSGREWLFKRIARVVENYNKKNTQKDE
ncbi:Vacuolar protein sorting-associated protein 13 [Vanrija albida]|uniref:Vacuolar protein sorting-associated protein 13 n=1 Tax=Vanrija albida TaxID=181172 RepID=A0ABR3Q7G4_9TREE